MAKNNRENAIQAYKTLVRERKKLIIEGDLIRLRARLNLLENEISMSDSNLRSALLESLFIQGATSLGSSMLPGVVFQFKNSVDILSEIIKANESPDLQKHADLVMRLLGLIPWVGTPVEILGTFRVLRSIENTHRSKVMQHKFDIKKLENIVQEIYYELGRLGKKGVLVDLHG